MGDEELLSYALAHSRTERALFAGGMVNRLLELAGYEERVEPACFVTIRYEAARDLVDAARERMGRADGGR